MEVPAVLCNNGKGETACGKRHGGPAVRMPFFSLPGAFRRPGRRGRGHRRPLSWYNGGKASEEESVSCTGPGSYMHKRCVMPTRLDALLNRWFSGNTMDYRQLFAIYVPVLVDQAFLVLMTMLNTAMISSSGVEAISAVNMVDSLNIFIISVFIALSTGGTVMVAQYKGSGNAAQMNKTASQAVVLVTLAAAAVSALVALLHKPILRLLFGAAEPAVMDNAVVFLLGNCLTFPLLGLFQGVAGVLRGAADTKAVLYLSVAMNVSYFLFNLVFITGLGMGVRGLVVSLVLARLIGAVAAFVYLWKYALLLKFDPRSALKPEKPVVFRLLNLGLPFAAEQLFFNGGKLLTQTFIVTFGTYALTANAIASTLVQVMQSGSSALSIAVVTVVGQCLGRQDEADARKFIRSILGLSAALMVLFSLILLPLYPWLIRLFAPPAEIVDDIFALLVLVAVAQPVLWSFSFIMPSALRAGGDAKFTSVTSMLSMWLLRVVLGYLLGVTFGFGLMGVWVAMVTEWGVRGLLFYWRFRGKKWIHRLV